MATAEVLKSTRNVDDNVQMLIDGIQSEFFSHTCCPNPISLDEKRARANLQQEKRSSFFTPAAPLT